MPKHEPIEEHFRRVWREPVFQWGRNDETVTVIVRSEIQGEEISTAIDDLAYATKLVTHDRVGTPDGVVRLDVVYACLCANASVKILQLMFKIAEAANA